MSFRQLAELELARLDCLDTAACRQLAQGRLGSLRDLNICHCELTAAAVGELLSAPWAQQLRVLCLSNNPLGDSGLLQIARANLSQLQHLDLEDTHLGTDKAAWCLQQLNLPQLTYLDLNSNYIGFELGLAGLSLAQLPQLRHLNVGCNGTSRDTLAELELLARGPWLHLEELRFEEREQELYPSRCPSYGNGPGLEAAASLREMSARISSLRQPPSLPSLTELHLGSLSECGWGMGREMGLEAVNTLTGLGLFKLQRLNCSNASFTKESLACLAAAPFPDLQHVDLQQNFEGDAWDIREYAYEQLDVVLGLGKAAVWSGDVVVGSFMGELSLGQLRKLAKGDLSVLQQAQEACEHRMALLVNDEDTTACRLERQLFGSSLYNLAARNAAKLEALMLRVLIANAQEWTAAKGLKPPGVGQSRSMGNTESQQRV
jgi:hypothetical protein